MRFSSFKRTAPVMVACLAVLTATQASGHAAEARAASTTARSAAMRQEKNYQVEVDNFSSQAFDEIALAFTRNSTPVTQILHQFNVPASSVVIFDLGPCSDVKQYAVSGLVGGERKFTTGDVDADPVGCDDIVTIRDTGALAMHRNAR
ncbi:hypothetical protein [Streptomyces morookaense]|uniref:Uncharacterized protein n=1 Tax=Streptomyces morookaense TaxID=1970 RepID=A0A7Y7B2U9_STRMO|nr:hypothetical protein [Streptomyces morookaense]NVK77907.1 hypothetical protein [Streptomyces morookaense]GHF20795.1 hypothetical protein GCM10010359_22690 [Streptomyces morookaense]